MLYRLKDCEGMDLLRIRGELLTANLYRLEKGMKEAELENWYAPEGGRVKIALDTQLSPSQNAQKYFKAYAKQKRTREALTPRKQKEEEEMEYTESLAASLSVAESAEDLKEIETELISLGLVKPQKEKVGGKKKETAAPFREYECGGFKILSGRNNFQNDRLLKSCAPSDLWLHAQKYHSTHRHGRQAGKRRGASVRGGSMRLLLGRTGGRKGARRLLRAQIRKKAAQIKGGIRDVYRL